MIFISALNAARQTHQVQEKREATEELLAKQFLEDSNFNAQVADAISQEKWAIFLTVPSIELANAVHRLLESKLGYDIKTERTARNSDSFTMRVSWWKLPNQIREAEEEAYGEDYIYEEDNIDD